MKTKIKEKQFTGLLAKITGLSGLFVFLAIIISAGMSIYSLRHITLDTAITMGEKKLGGDMASFEYMIAKEYGFLAIKDGDLTDENGISIHDDNEKIDRFSKDLNVVATIFIKEDHDYRRVLTSITDKDGNRAIDTYLGKDSAPYASVDSGKEYTGLAELFNRSYFTSYKPVISRNPGEKNEVIGILFIGMELSSYKEAIMQDCKEETIKVGFVSAGIFLLSVFLNTMSCRKMLIKPIKSAVEMLKEISRGEGDLTRQLTVKSSDEIGEMAHYFNLTLEKIKRLVITIKEQAGTLFDVGGELSNTMTETAAAVNQITANIQSIKGQVVNQSTSVTQTSETMEQITGNINKLNVHIERQSSSVSQSSSAIEEMLANIQTVTQTLFKNSENIKELFLSSESGSRELKKITEDIHEIANDSEGLLEINTVIKKIAAQTNLLSMNAAIEAAHAGKAGSGFSVVANEIRTLAESSDKQSKSVSQVLLKIKKSIENMTGSMERILAKFEAMHVILRTIADQGENIRNAMAEQDEGGKQILEAVGYLNEITFQVKDGSNEMMEGSREIMEKSKNLEIVAQEITGGMNEMAAGAAQINIAVNKVNELGVKNKENINYLMEEVSRFKVA